MTRRILRSHFIGLPYGYTLVKNQKQIMLRLFIYILVIRHFCNPIFIIIACYDYTYAMRVTESLLFLWCSQARPGMTKSTVVDNETGKSVDSTVRTSTGTFFNRGEDEVVRRIEKRIAQARPHEIL